MANPASELKAKKQEFISIRELIARVQKLHPEMTIEQIANWILIKLDEAGQYAPNLLIQDSRGITRSGNYSDPRFSSYDLMTRVMIKPEMDEPLYEGWSPSKSTPPMDFDDDIPF